MHTHTPALEMICQLTRRGTVSSSSPVDTTMRQRRPRGPCWPHKPEHRRWLSVLSLLTATPVPRQCRLHARDRVYSDLRQRDVASWAMGIPLRHSWNISMVCVACRSVITSEGRRSTYFRTVRPSSAPHILPSAAYCVDSATATDVLTGHQHDPRWAEQGKQHVSAWLQAPVPRSIDFSDLSCSSSV